RYRHFISAGRQRRRDVIALAVRLELRRDSRALVGDGDFGVGHGALVAVLHRADDPASDSLRVNVGNCGERQGGGTDKNAAGKQPRSAFLHDGTPLSIMSLRLDHSDDLPTVHFSSWY